MPIGEYGWIDTGDGRQVYRRIERTEVKRSTLPAPMVNLDTMPETQSMLDGKFYTSKSKLRETYRQGGVIEVGNDPARHRPRQKVKPDRKGIRDAIDRATARFDRGERADRSEVKL